METHIKLIGILCIILASIHAFFPRYFGWKKDLQSIALINRQMLEVHTFFLALALLLIGILCLSSTADLVASPLGKRICLGLAIFWFLRLLFQFFVYSPSLWKGKPKETIIHILFAVLWLYLTCIFTYIALF